MNEIVREWIDKAGADFATARRELAVADAPNYDAVGFHAQQCVEKLMKGLLIAQGVRPPKVHDLVELDRLLASVCTGWSWSMDELEKVSRAAVGCRYPGDSLLQEDAGAVFKLAEKMRQKLLALLDASALS